MAREDCFAFDLEHRSGAGFGDRGDCPPTIQLAFEYVSLEKMCDPPGEEDEEGTEGPETATEPGTHRLDRDRDRHPQGPSRWLVRRIRRVCTRQARVASSPRDLYANAAEDAAKVKALRTNVGWFSSPACSLIYQARFPPASSRATRPASPPSSLIAP